MRRTNAMGLKCWAFVAFIAAALVACNSSRSQRHVRVLVVHPGFADAAVLGFADGLAKGGFREGTNLEIERIVADDATPEQVAKALAARPDLVFSVMAPATKAVLAATQGTQIPVVFWVFDPVESGFVPSLAHPGGRATGVQIRGSTPKALEWLLALKPTIKHVFVPIGFDTDAAAQSVADVKAFAERLGIRVTLATVASEAELDQALAAMPADVDAGFVVHSHLIARHIGKIVAAARARRIPLGSSGSNYNQGVTISFGLDRRRAGEQAGVIANKILNGRAPGDVPAEVVTFYLGVNLPSARAIGIDVPDDIVNLADFVIR